MDVFSNTNPNSWRYNAYLFLGLLIFSLAQRVLMKQNQSKRKLLQPVYILIGCLIVYDLFCLLFFRIKPLTYFVQLIVVGIYFLYEKWKNKSKLSL